MARLSESTLRGFLDRFQKIAPDAVPIWGKMTVPQMIGHVNGAVRYSMGYGPDIPFKGNWKTKYVFAPLILNGIKQVPRNIKVPRPKGAQSYDPPVAELPTLESTLLELLGKVRDGSFNPPPPSLLWHDWSTWLDEVSRRASRSSSPAIRRLTPVCLP